MPTFGATRVLVRALIPDIYKTYKSASKALEFLKGEGLGYRRKDFLADWREILGLKAKEDVWKYIRKDYKPSPELFEPTDLRLSKKYQYIGKLEYLDKWESLRVQEISLDHDEILTIRQVEDMLKILDREQIDRYQVERVIGVHVIGGRVRKEV